MSRVARIDEKQAGCSAMNGVVVVDKPAGKTSFDVIRDMRKILGIRKIGHTGTLDPLATGVLPLCINEATKMVPFLVEDDKEYRATMILGVTTDTQDITGRVLATGDPENITRADLEAAASDFVGVMEQKIPRYSAAKYRGRPYHRWTREGVFLDTPVKEIDVQGIEIESFSPPYVTFLVRCSKGTYIRTLCDDMGKRLGCGAALAGLRRIRSGRFREENALSLEEISNGEGPRLIQDKMVPLKDVLEGLAAIPLCRDLARKIREGCQPGGKDLKDSPFPVVTEGSLVRLVTEDNNIVAVARMLRSSESMPAAGEKEQVLKLVRVFKEQTIYNQ